MRIDAHHHFWSYTPAEYDWIDNRMQVLRHNFLPADLRHEIQSAGVHATVAVEARPTLAETDWLLALAKDNEFIRGVVGWAPIASVDFPSVLSRLLQNLLLKGLRHAVQGEPDGFLDRHDFNRGIARLRDTKLVYDLLILPRQLAETVRFADRHPNQIFVLDHIAKPNILDNQFDAWNSGIHELARRDNVICKLSGMVTEADWSRWTAESLRPYFDTVLNAFGPSRLMAGTDWPVLTAACAYRQWWHVVTDWIAPLSVTERDEIEGAVANRIYRLNVSPSSSK